MVDKEHLADMREKSRQIYARIVGVGDSMCYDAEYTELWNTWEKLLHAWCMFDNELFNLSATWKDDGTPI